MATRKCLDEGTDPDLWFAKPGSEDETKAVLACLSCPFKAECADEALESGIPYGVWGGLTALNRRAIWKNHGGRPKQFDQWRVVWLEGYAQRKIQELEWAQRNPPAAESDSSSQTTEQESVGAA